MALFQNKYRIETTRLKGWNYSSSGYYFITICTKNKKKYFGKINNGHIILTQIGEIVSKEWKKTEEFRNNVKLDFWTIMPNHIHGIVIIDKNVTQEIVETHSDASLPLHDNLSNIVRGFKASVSKQVHEAGYLEFEWQSRYYDHIIRNENSLNKIRKYIKYNAIKWEYDRENLNEISFNEKKKYWKSFLKKR